MGEYSNKVINLFGILPSKRLRWSFLCIRRFYSLINHPLKYYLCRGRKSSLFFNKLCTPSPIEPRRRSTTDRVGSVDVIRSFIVFSTVVSSSKKVEETMGRPNKIPSPIPSIIAGIIEVIGLIVILFTYYYE